MLDYIRKVERESNKAIITFDNYKFTFIIDNEDAWSINKFFLKKVKDLPIRSMDIRFNEVITSRSKTGSIYRTGKYYTIDTFDDIHLLFSYIGNKVFHNVLKVEFSVKDNKNLLWLPLAQVYDLKDVKSFNISLFVEQVNPN